MLTNKRGNSPDNHSYRTSSEALKYLLQLNLSFTTPPFMGHLYLGDTKFGPEKKLAIKRKGTLFLGPETQI